MVKVLIVEDNPRKVMDVVDSLRQVGINDYDVEEITSSVISRYERLDYDLMIVDLGLKHFANEFPEDYCPIEGYCLLRALSSRDVNIPAIIFSDTELDEQAFINLEETKFLGQVTTKEELDNKLKLLKEKDFDFSQILIYDEENFVYTNLLEDKPKIKGMDLRNNCQ